jgi:hypothetical protein
MAKVKNPLLSLEARGALNGLVYNTWRGISYVKVNTSPTGQGTPLRLQAQATLASVSNDWQGLSDGERAGWKQYAIDHPVTDWTGNPKRLTGMNWFIRCNVMRSRLGLAIVKTAPVVAAPDPVVDLGLTKNLLNLEVGWTSPDTDSNKLEFRIAGPLSAGIDARIEQSQFAMFLAGDEINPYIIVTGHLKGRYTVWARSVLVANGLASTWVSDTLDAT